MKPIDPDQIDRLLDNIDRQIENHVEMAETLREMKRLFQLAKIEPRVVEGRMSYRLASLSSSFYPSFNDWVFVVRYMIGTPEEGATEFDLREVPRDFWPDDLRAYVERKERAAERRKARLPG